jgi:phage terminase large subunit-like protein
MSTLTLTRKTTDTVTKRWIRNASDERAAAEGCTFDEERGQFVVDWIERYCRLYEGEFAGQSMTLGDWQLEATMRLFGWVRDSTKWGRKIRRFTRASIWVPKKNKKSPTLAAWGLYLLCGDGEPGQKVFLAAKDGNQAREIAGKHAIEMLYQCPELYDPDDKDASTCTINLNLQQITHNPTRSLMKPLSSGADRNRRAKEGLNGSCLIDETHVVDDEFMSIISRAGISRSEPLHIEVSTAGDNPDGYGKKQFDKAAAIISGDQYQQNFFALIYAAPQDLNDADLDADPLKWGRMANPAMGHTVDPEEYLADYQSSKTSLLELGRFKMYRLNIWQRSANPWIRMSDWDQCRQAFTVDDLAGMECCAGLDLSKTRDMSSLVLTFPWEDGYRVLPFFWMPEDEARDKNHLAPFLQWAADGWLTLTPGNTVDYGYIRSQFRDLAQRVLIRELYYDKTYADETTQNLEQGVIDASGKELEPGTGVTRREFAQSLMTFTGPSKDFERLISGKKLWHNGHPILTWQIGHVTVWRDANDNIRPIKPKDGGIKKIDGVVAGIMSLFGAQQLRQGTPISIEVW